MRLVKEIDERETLKQHKKRRRRKCLEEWIFERRAQEREEEQKSSLFIWKRKKERINSWINHHIQFKYEQYCWIKSMRLHRRISMQLIWAYPNDGNARIANGYLSCAIHEFLRFEHSAVDRFWTKSNSNWKFVFFSCCRIKFLPIDKLKKKNIGYASSIIAKLMNNRC